MFPGTGASVTIPLWRRGKRREKNWGGLIIIHQNRLDSLEQESGKALPVRKYLLTQYVQVQQGLIPDTSIECQFVNFLEDLKVLHGEILFIQFCRARIRNTMPTR